MIKPLLSFILILIIVSCKKDDLQITPREDNAKFLTTSLPIFIGNLGGNNFSWSNGGQGGQWGGYTNDNCDPTNPMKIVIFGLSLGGQTAFKLYSPKHNTTSQEEFDRLFSLGKKKLGDFQTDFHLEILKEKENKFYQSSSLASINEIEILKTEEFTDYFGQKLRVWFKITAKLSCNSTSNDNDGLLSNGLMIAEFQTFKKE